MKSSSYCYNCLAKLARQAADLSSSDPVVRARAAEAGLAELERNFSLDKVTIAIAATIHRAVREVTGNTDPYRAMKDRELEISRRAYPEVRRRYDANLSGLVKIAALGNTIDFFRPPEAIIADLQKPVTFAVDETNALEARLRRARRILYLADNTGEQLFDLPLLEFMRRCARTTYVVKAGPVQNDVTLADIEASGLRDRIGDIMTTGTATPGVVLPEASQEFRDAFGAADLIFAKGMGYWETLSELPAEGHVFHCLMVKCQPVAQSVGTPIGSYVARFR